MVKRINTKKGGNTLTNIIRIFIRNYTYNEKDTQIKELISNGFDINNQIVYESQEEEQKLNILFFLCKYFCKGIRNQTIENIQLVLENGADVNFRNLDNDTPLLFCLNNFDRCNSRFYNLIDFLIDEGADVNSTDDFMNTPLHLACYFDDFNLIKLLLDNNNTVIDTFNNDNDTPLIIYCKENNNFDANNFNYFISKGANINVKNSDDESLLTLLSFNCNYDGAVKLFEQNNFIYDTEMLNNALNDIISACDNNTEKYKFIELLIEKGAEIQLIDIPDFFGENLPYIYELKSPENLEIIETISNIDITEGFDFFNYADNNIDDFIDEHGNNALVFYLKINDDNFKTTLINKKEQLINGYNDRSNIFYKCKDYNKKNNYKNNVEFTKPYYKLQFGEMNAYIFLKDFLKIVKSTHKFWIISENRHDKIKSLCSRSNLFSELYDYDRNPLNYDGNVINLMSGFHCEVDTENDMIDYYENYDTKIYEIIYDVNKVKKLRKFNFKPFFSYFVKPTERIIKNKKTPRTDTGSPKSSPSSSRTKKRKTPSPPRKTKKSRT